MPDERKESAAAFLNNALAWFAAHGVAAQRVMTDNGSAFKSQLSPAPLPTRPAHKRTRPYTPKTNGKAERFIQTSIREWAYATPFNTSADRTRAMHPGCTPTASHHNTHLAMSLKTGELLGREAIPRGGSGSCSPG